MLPSDPRFPQAVQLHQAGRLADAEPLYRDVLRNTPDHPHALHLLGVLAHQTGRNPEAADLIRRALAAHGPHPVFHANLASVYLALNQLEEAAAQGQEAVRLKPEHPDAHNNLGVALRRLGRHPEAEAEFRQAVWLNPNHVDARANLGAVLQQKGNLPESLAHLREAVRLNPRHAQARNDLGGTLIACNDLAAAAEQLREAIRLRPDFPAAHNNLGLTLRDLDQIGDAERCFREAIRLDTAYTAGRNSLAANLEMQGRMPEAAAEFRDVLRLEPRNAIALAGLGRMAAEGFCDLTDAEARGVVDVVADESLSPGERGRLHFALAARCDRAGEYAEAFEHARRGNAFRRENDTRGGLDYDPAAHERGIDRVIAAFDAAYFQRVRGFGSSSELPVFVVGMMRSGTTLVEQILASHPRVYGAGELTELGAIADQLPRLLGGEYPECVANLDEPVVRSLAEKHLGRLRSMGGTAERVADKMPSNFLRVGLIATLFPKARIVHCRREAADTCLSCYFQNFASPNPFTTDLRQLGHFYRQYERVMAHWAAVLPVPVFDLHYEELTADQEGVSRRLIEFCGLPWDERCLRFSDTKRAVRTASALQVRQPMYARSVGRWKRYEPFLAPLLEELRR